MAEAELLPSVLDLLYLGDIAQEAWTLSFYYVTWLRQAWPVKVAVGYISYAVSDVTPAAVSSLLGAACYVTNGVHYAADMLDATVTAMPATVVTNHYLLVTMGDCVMGWAAPIIDVFTSVFQTAEPLICTLFEETFLALSTAVQLVPNPIEVRTATCGMHDGPRRHYPSRCTWATSHTNTNTHCMTEVSILMKQFLERYIRKRVLSRNYFAREV